MAIEAGLKNLIEHGDWKILATLFNETHRRHVTASYVLKVVRGTRSAKEGTAAAEILPFVEEYLKTERSSRSELPTTKNHEPDTSGSGTSVRGV